MSIPDDMKVNKTQYAADERLVRAILRTCKRHLQKSSVGDYCIQDRLFVSIEWRGFPFAKRLGKYYCITVDRMSPNTPPTEREDYRLVKYHDFTRVYYPGVWERVFTGDKVSA